METITLKMEENMVREIDQKLAGNRYSTRTEFIRDAIRDKLSDLEKEELLRNIEKLSGSSNRKTTDEQLHAVREMLAEKYEKKFGFR